MSKLFISAKPETPRMFKSSFFEMFSKTHWSVPAIVFIPIISYLIYLGIDIGIGLLHATISIIFGLIFWSFTEYVLHRFVFHYHPKSDFGKKINWIFHGVHHDYPQDPLRLVMPPSVSLPLAFLFFLLFSATLGRWFGEDILYVFTAGFLIGYLIYDLGHYFLHHAAFKSGYIMRAKKHHMNHHYKDPDHGYGVSSAIWDRVFGTNFPEKK